MGTLVRCEHCGKRVRTNGLKVHNKQCVKRKRALKLEYNKRNTQSLEDRINRLKPLVSNIESYNLANLTDLQFNALADNLEQLNVRKKEKEIELETKRIDAEMAIKAEELKAMEISRKNLAIKAEEEKERIKQANIEAEKIKNAQEKKDKVQKEVAEKIDKLNPKEKPKDEIVKSEIEAIDKTVENILPKKKPGRKKKI